MEIIYVNFFFQIVKNIFGIIIFFQKLTKISSVVTSQYYGWHREREILVSWFFQFLVSRREMGGDKREINFLHFLPHFGQISDKF